MSTLPPPDNFFLDSVNFSLHPDNFSILTDWLHYMENGQLLDGSDNIYRLADIQKIEITRMFIVEFTRRIFQFARTVQRANAIVGGYY